MTQNQDFSTPTLPVYNRLQPYRNLTIILAVAVLAHVAIFVDLPLFWRSASVLLLTAFLPGLLFVDWLLGGDDRPLPESWERSLYALAAGYGIVTAVLLLLSYLPGGLIWWQTLLAFDAVLLVLLALLWRRRSLALRDTTPVYIDQPAAWPAILPSAQRDWLLAAVFSIVLIGGFLRFNDLGYSEFQGDEARAVLRAAEVIQGYHDALLSHKKGPVEILVPTGAYSLVDRLDEQSARLPFALANVAGAACRLPARLAALPSGRRLGRGHAPCAGRLLHRLRPHRAISEHRLPHGRARRSHSLPPGAQPAQPVPLPYTGLDSARHRPARALRGRACGPSRRVSALRALAP